MRLFIREGVWAALSERTQAELSSKAHVVFRERDEAAKCIFCSVSLSPSKLAFCMTCLVKQDPEFWADYKKGREKENEIRRSERSPAIQRNW